jgi:hypothetical protein
MSKTWTWLTQQKILPVIGGIKDVAMMSAFYISILNIFLVAVTAYHTTLQQYILVVFPWFKMWTFLLVLILLAALMMVLEYKFVYASWFTFRNKQEFEHENLIRKEIDELRKDLGLPRKKGEEEGNDSK